MQLRHSYMTLGGGYLAMEDEHGRHYAFFVYGKDEARRVLTKYASDDPNTATVLSDLDRAPVPDTATQPTVELEGTFVITLAKMASYAAQLADGRLARLTTDARATVCSLFTSTDRAVQDALIGYVNDAKEHHIFVFFSKEQGELVVDGMRAWLPKEKQRRIKEHINNSGLPKRTTRMPIDITGGTIAGYLNCSYMAEKAAAAEPSN